MDKTIRQAKNYCKKIFKNSRCKNLPFHNLNHTMEVLSNVEKIGAYEGIPFSEQQPILLAALFHDTGNAFRFQGHEEVSAAYAILFMEKKGYSEDLIKTVCSLILATKLPQNPKNSYENIICDADLFHLGTKTYMAKNELLRSEWANYLEIEYSDKAWDTLNINFFEQHRFYSKYGREVLTPVKQENLKQLKFSF
jgi:predicted metal-dependent HD superfamily phosphohydrolase